jgi:hypothetical protein
MSTVHSVASGHPQAARRTELLHRMLRVRHLIEHGAAVPAAGFHLGEEAIAVGILAAVGPRDAIVPTGQHGTSAIDLARGTVEARWDTAVVWLLWDDELDAAGWLKTAEVERLPVLFCRCPGAAPEAGHCDSLTTEAVDGLDAEAVLTAIGAALHAVRSGDGPRLLEFCAADEPIRRGPIECLAMRMFTDHELDQNAFRAIDAHALASVEATLGTGAG